jgi:hypothetical protein
MHPSKVARLEAQGWKVGSVAEFLDLTEVDVKMIDIRIALDDGIRARTAAGIERRAKRNRAGASRRSRSPRASAPIEESIRTLLELGATRKDIGRMVSSIAR